MYGMPYFAYNHDNNQEYNQEYDNDDYGYDNTPMGPGTSGRGKFHRNGRYASAYGNYRGGYAPGMMFMSPDEMGQGPGSFMLNNEIRPLMGHEESVSGWIRGYGPNGPTRHRGQTDDKYMRHLIRCGVPRDNLKNLPKELLHKFQTDHCGVCSHSFDSNNSAKLHYLSRTHMKNQKKWLIKRLDAAPLTCETPLKDRELYCELCDIHITSKQHADSHYSGKAHRSIVEGRKDPRNGALLRRDMEERYEQLIEREKKCLRKAPVVKKDTPTKVKDTKEAPPELCCHICKTVVTCSEQMTNHLNGKKHLSKEKQYILRTMRGAVPEQGDKSTYTQETYQQDIKEDAANEENNGDNDENFPEEQ